MTKVTESFQIELEKHSNHIAVQGRVVKERYKDIEHSCLLVTFDGIKFYLKSESLEKALSNNTYKNVLVTGFCEVDKENNKIISPESWISY